MNQLKKSKKRRPRSPKGTCGYHNSKGIWRLQWWCPIQKKRRYANTGLRCKDGLLAENGAKGLALLITNDIFSGNYDVSLKKYGLNRPAVGTVAPRLTVNGLIEQWLKYRQPKVCDRTYRKYHVTVKHLTNWGGRLLERGVDEISEDAADDFDAYIKALGIHEGQRKRHLELLKAVWAWGIGRSMIAGQNPWVGTYKAIKVPPTQPPEPFSPEEKDMIIARARSDIRFVHYADFIEVLFASGCRIGEVAGFRGRHVRNGGQNLWIGEMMVRGKPRPIKGYKAREIRLTPRLIKIIGDRNAKLASRNDLLFTSPNGESIRDGNFLKRVWKPLLQSLGINYRSPKYTRHSLVSNALEMGLSPVYISQITGHSTRVLHDHYSGWIGNQKALPEVY